MSCMQSRALINTKESCVSWHSGAGTTVAFAERARPSTAAETWKSAIGIYRSHIIQHWPAHRDPAAKAALSMVSPFGPFALVLQPSTMCTLRTKPKIVHDLQEGGDDIKSHWDDYQPPHHPVLHDLDVEE